MLRPLASGEWELYNLTQDPGEIDDLSSEYPEKVEEMVALWEQYSEDNSVLDISYDHSDAVE